MQYPFTHKNKDSTAVHIMLNYLFDVKPPVFPYVLNRELKVVDRPFDQIDLILSAWQEPDVGYLDPAVEYLQSKKFKSITIVYDTWQQSYYQLEIPATFVNSMLLLSSNNVVTDRWHYDQNRGFLITGQLGRLNRIGLLKKLYDQQLLINDKMIWVAPIKCQDIWIESVSKITGLAGIELDKFLEYCLNNAIHHPLDFEVAQYIDQLVASDGLNIGLPASTPSSTRFTDQFKQSNFSVVSEAHYTADRPAVSEKTWRVIAHKHPFIIAGAPGILKYMRSLGFRTFEHYVDANDYDQISNPEHRLDVIVEHVAKFPNAIKLFTKEINNDIEHNYNLLKTIANDDFTKLLEIYDKFNFPPVDIYKNFLLEIPQTVDLYQDFVEFSNVCAQLKKQAQHDLWVSKYRLIKGESWPDLSHSDEFQQLPQWIKDECMRDFNFSGTTKFF